MNLLVCFLVSLPTLLLLRRRRRRRRCCCRRRRHLQSPRFILQEAK